MRALAYAAIGLVLLFGSVARGDDAADAAAIISSQLDAFTHDDAKAAFALAAPAIQQKFGDAETFMTVVKTAYPPVYRRHSVTFGKATRSGDELEQDVTFIDQSNVVWTGVYKMARQADGQWKITGCVLMQSLETSL